MTGKPPAERASFVVYAVGLGLMGALLAYFAVEPYLDLLRERILIVLIFSLLIGLAWGFPFSILPRARMSMDYVFLVAALAVLPPPLPHAAGVGAIVVGILVRRGEGAEGRPGWALSCLNGGILLATIAVGTFIAQLEGPAWSFSTLTWENVLGVVGMFVALDLTRLVLLSAAVHLRRSSAREFARHHLLYISPLEIFTIPLVLALASLYVNSGLIAFLCLGASLLLFSYLFHHLNRVEEGIRRINQSLSDRTSELAALNAIGKEVSASLDPTQVCTVVSRYCREVFPTGILFIAVAEPERREVISRFVHRGQAIASEDRLPVGSGFVDWVLKTRRPLMIHDLFEEGGGLPFPPVMHDPTLRSLLMVPLVVEHRATGVMGMADPVPHRFDIDRLSVLTTIAQQAAVAIENARHYQLATVDQLTGLYLRHHFLQRLADERTRAQRYRSPFAVLVLDLDTFKAVNDRHGHNVGDHFLKMAAGAILQSLRGSDMACRWGGDEFCVLLPQTDVESAVSTSERIRKRIEAMSTAVPGVRATASVGIATYPTDFDGHVEDLVRRADQALYRAKREGRDRVAVFSIPAGESAAEVVVKGRSE